MASWLARRDREGWSWAELSRRSGHPTWRLRYWSRRLARTSVAPRAGDCGFVTVAVREPATGAALAITTPSGYRVQVPADFDAEHLRRVLATLERRC